MKILKTKQVNRMRKYPPGKFWHEGLGDKAILEVVKSKKLWAYWTEARSYIWHRWGSKHYWCVSKGYLDEHRYKV